MTTQTIDIWVVACCILHSQFAIVEITLCRYTTMCRNTSMSRRSSSSSVMSRSSSVGSSSSQCSDARRYQHESDQAVRWGEGERRHCFCFFLRCLFVVCVVRFMNLRRFWVNDCWLRQDWKYDIVSVVRQMPPMLNHDFVPRFKFVGVPRNTHLNDHTNFGRIFRRFT